MNEPFGNSGSSCISDILGCDGQKFLLSHVNYNIIDMV